MPDRDQILSAADPSLEEAGSRGIHTCLSTTSQDTVTVVTDRACQHVGAPFLEAAIALGATTRAYIVENHCSRPTSKLPEPIIEALASSTVTILAMNPQPGEFKARYQVVSMVSEHGLRHAHLVAVNVEALRLGMRADYEAIDALQDRILSILDASGGAQISSRTGTSLEVTFSPSHRWIKSNGLIRPGEWQNLPSGQVYTCPGNAEGTYVVDRTVGDWFESRYPDLAEHPVTLDISAGRVRQVACENKKLARELSLFTRSSENGDRIGEIGFGTNPFLPFLRAQMTSNEDVPGAHLALGNPIPDKTGASWTSKVRLPMVGAGMTVTAGDGTILEEGVFAPVLLEGLPSLLTT